MAMGQLYIHNNMNLDSYLTLYIKINSKFRKHLIKINSKFIIDLNIRAKIVKLSEDNVGKYLLDFG